ncbi:hypothetical protein [Bradymonas sediminis]|uniref:Uncharacterized protein n=1 Tax=Bradymonas sediminis TaxID=1548548 RepID=A0A2Z4FQE2_9DELT|nr:hypothetical protein [Bradymonas sediminis]AWV90878.1 hypothetical protein DN745_16735 [Bradymonas sediminis]TDP75385.1 hypothetical protein DFR33_104252 [Bradymonas sediminis]
MSQNLEGNATKIKSPHPDLQAILPRFRALNPDAAESRPVFDNRAKARLFIDIQSVDEQQKLRLMPLWDIDHGDLEASKIRAWSVTRRPC